MRPFARLEGHAIAMMAPNIDTDRILPKQFLRTTERRGLGSALFYDERFDADGREIAANRFMQPDLVLLIAGDNFGCGSSREHAAWALDDFGLRCVIAPSFADIFSANCANCGVLLIALDDSSVSALERDARAGHRFTIDLEQLQISTSSGLNMPFDLEPRLRRKLLQGLDEIAATALHAEAIRAFEAKHDVVAPWLAQPSR